MIHKYRVWDVQNKFMGDVTFLGFIGPDHIEVDYIGNDKEPRKVCDEEVIIMEHTGLNDLNGNDLDWWDKDILEWITRDSVSRVIILWDAENGRWCYDHLGGTSEYAPYAIDKFLICKYHKIGNKHGNPGLL